MKLLQTATKTDMSNCPNGNLVLYLEYLANPKIELNLIPNRLYSENVGSQLVEKNRNLKNINYVIY